MKKILTYLSLLILIIFITNSHASVYGIRILYGTSNTPGEWPSSYSSILCPDCVSDAYQLCEESFEINYDLYLKFMLRLENVGGPASLFIDNVELIGPSGPVTIVNSGFESGTSGWNKVTHIGDNGSFTVTNDAYEGSNAALITISTGQFYGITNQPPVAVPESGTYTLRFHTKAYETPRQIPPDEIFAMEVGNFWEYDSGHKRVVTGLDTSTFEVDAYEMTIYENNIQDGKEWYEAWKGYLRNWGISNSTLYEFSYGIPVAWFPANVGDKYESITWISNYTGVSLSLTAEVLGVEPVVLDFDTIDAYRFRYNYTVSGPGGTDTTSFDWWCVPNIGVIQQQMDGGVEKIVSFSVGGGLITIDTDTDNDGLQDYKELIIGTDREDSDTDDDGCEDGAEVLVGRDPLISTPAPQGDMNNDCMTNLSDCILALKVIVGLESVEFNPNADVNSDGRIGLEETIYIIQEEANLR